MNPLDGLRESHFVRHAQEGTRKHAERFRGPARHATELVGLRRGAQPDYLMIGSMKAGSTMFYDWLTDHPLVPAAVEKEVHFFDFHFMRGLTWYRSQLPTERRREALTARYGQRPMIGEASPTYLFHPLAARRAHSVVPDAKLIVLLRNPVNRAYSHYNTGIRHDWEALSFEGALDREPERLHGQIDAMLMDEKHHRNFPRYRWSYQAMGHYAELLEHWLQYYPREQFLFLLSEDMDRDPETTFRRAYDFLELPYHPLRARERRTVGRYPKMHPATRERLEDYFRPHNARLTDLIGIAHGWES